MSIGMSYDEFWNQDVALVRAYRKADDLRRQRQNDMMWLQGIYMRDALLCTVGNMFSGNGATPNEYPKEPYPVTEAQITKQREAERRKAEERMKADMMAIAARMIKQKMPAEAHPDIRGGEINEYHD